MLYSPYTYTSIIVCITRAHNRSLSDALQQLGPPKVIHKPEQGSAKYTLHMVVYQPGLGSQLPPDACVCFESMSEKCAVGGSGVVAFSPSSCNFLLMVDMVIQR